MQFNGQKFSGLSEKVSFNPCFFGLKTFCGFSMGSNQYWAGRVYDLCVYYMTGTPEGSTESGFMEKPGIEPAIPGLQGIALIHYTTAASLFGLKCKNMIFWRKTVLIEVLYQILVQLVKGWSSRLQKTPILEILTKIDFLRII